MTTAEQLNDKQRVIDAWILSTQKEMKSTCGNVSFNHYMDGGLCYKGRSIAYTHLVNRARPDSVYKAAVGAVVMIAAAWLFRENQAPTNRVVSDALGTIRSNNNDSKEFQQLLRQRLDHFEKPYVNLPYATVTGLSDPRYADEYTCWRLLLVRLSTHRYGDNFRHSMLKDANFLAEVFGLDVRHDLTLEEVPDYWRLLEVQRRLTSRR